MIITKKINYTRKYFVFIEKEINFINFMVTVHNENPKNRLMKTTKRKQFVNATCIPAKR